MRYGPFLFLGLLFALSASWLGMVVTPQLQLGGEQPTNVPPASVIYPVPYAGLANQGREVYRANGCASCHTQVVRQDGTVLHVVLVEAGTNAPAVVNALVDLGNGLSKPEAEKELKSLPRTVLTASTGAAASAAEKVLTAAGAKISIRTISLGADIERGWGSRLTVARDYLYDQPLMLGLTRLGPDLTNVGLRRPDRVWQLIHLYNPALETPGSMMPRYPFLFEARKRGAQPSKEALPIPGPQEIVPTQQAEALVAYLLNLRAEMPLFEAPGPQVALPVAEAAATNSSTGVAPNAAGPAGLTNSNVSP